MSNQPSDRGGRYLYAIVAASEARDYGECGIEEGLVYAITEGMLAAVVSNIKEEKLRPERRNLAAHQGVLRRLMEESTPLPMSFGIIADGPGAIMKILSQNQETLLKQIDYLAGKEEMGLRVTWDVPNIFEYFVSTHTELRAARDRYFGTHREPTQEEKIEIGRMFERVLNEDREAHTEEVEKILSRYCFAIKRNKCRNESDVMNLACLTGRDGQAEFEKGVFEAAGLFDNNFAFDYNGPWAPHNFVEMDIVL